MKACEVCGKKVDIVMGVNCKMVYVDPGEYRFVRDERGVYEFVTPSRERVRGDLVQFHPREEIGRFVHECSSGGNNTIRAAT